MTKPDPLVIFTPSGKRGNFAVGGKPFLAAGNPIKISGMDDTLKDARAPTLDGDRQAILDWIDQGS